MSKREQFDYYKDCPDCTGKKYGPDTSPCNNCYQTGIVSAHPAAGEWRTDMENAPRDGLVLVAYVVGIVQLYETVTASTLFDGRCNGQPIVAWAHINPPEAPDA